ncbi:pentatricopeptide repeat-containing protein OGR1, mitochondrial-like [Nymphaea colorata]|uniref:DYW domain-containing protein n=1 Tax=Nymphaea colorata TaxID=210225 RepID=A0A5K1DJ27_9MAGN|nr:pentatricopeptide repeat-containing protein OGR1, mitochondrial-like [Nymphaea colorata]
MAYALSLLQRCTGLAHLRQVHAHMVVTGLANSVHALTKLVEFCALLSDGVFLDYAGEIFRQVAHPTTTTWNAMIRGLAQGPDPKLAILLYPQIQKGSFSSSLRPDALSVSFALKACARLLGLKEGQELHAQVFRFGFASDSLLQTTLMDLYFKTSRGDDARQVFDELPKRDIVAWNVIVAGYAQCGRSNDALVMFRCMQQVPDLRPNEVTILGALSACSQLGAADDGESVHAYARQHALDRHCFVGNALIDMYAKCGRVDRALQVFDEVPQRSLVSWNTMIMAFAMHGRAHDALALYQKMKTAKVAPDSVTFLAVLGACNHAGLVEDGRQLLRSMEEFRVVPNVKHYGCVVDLLGRAGRLEEAYDLIVNLPVEVDVVLWQSLLGACYTYGNVELAERAMQRLAELNSNNSGDFVLMSNVYAASARWDDVGRTREAMKRVDVVKTPGFSYIKVDGVIHKFVMGDQEHEKSKEIYEKLDEICARARLLGYAPKTSFVLHDIDEEDKENALSCHSEKLAVAFGLLSTDGGSPILVIKNLRICGDCHALIKLVSKIYGREIIVRDRTRFHHFAKGLCSCKDYW